MNLYLTILRSFLTKSTYDNFNSFLNRLHLKENYPELFKVLNAIDLLHQNASESSPETFSLGDLELALHTAYPNTKIEVFGPIFKRLEESNVDPAVVSNYFKQLQIREKAAKAARKLLDVAEGQAEMEQISPILEDLSAPSVETEELQDFVENDVTKLFARRTKEAGLYWRLDTLNRALGPLYKGDFGFVFARPETGKTTFLASEITHMAKTAPNYILWFNNEEGEDKVLSRIIQAGLGIDYLALQSNTEKHTQDFKEITNDKVRLIKDASITKKRVELLCKRYKPSLVILDQIDAIRGFTHDDRNDIELKNIYVWARELAKTVCPVIAVCQAGASGEGKKWLTMNDVDNSKTGKQSTADWILGIGKTHDDGFEAVRYLHLSKNKSLMTQEKDASLRHGKWEVLIKPEIARYKDFD